MATMDVIKLYGGEPANFLDVGGGANEEQVKTAFSIILEDPNVKGILVNIFGGIMRCDIIAEGVVSAARTLGLDKPLVVRLEGTNVDEGKRIMADSGLAIIPADNLADAAEKITHEQIEEVMKKGFKAKYGYDLGVPLNQSAYEDIAKYFSEDVKNIDGVRIYGHMDYGKRAPDLGWRMTDAWLSMAGAGDVGKPNGIPVDEWGIRMEKGSCNPVGASVTRGGAANGPAAVYAIRKWDEWLRNYAPPGAAAMDFYQSLPSLSSGNVAQQILWYTAFTASLVGKNPNNKVVDSNGKPLWRMGPSPKGPYWEEGMKLGYQDAGSWTLFKSTPVKNRKAAWLYAQFVVSKTVDLKKSHVGLTIIRDSSIDHKSFTERADALGGLVEFYRSDNRNIWSPTGINVPDYPKLAQIWWQQIGDVNSGAFTPQQAMDRLAEEMDLVMSRMEAADKGSNAYGGCGPRLNKPREASYWLNKKGSPKAKRNEKPQGKTVPYAKAWKQ